MLLFLTGSEVLGRENTSSMGHHGTAWSRCSFWLSSRWTPLKIRKSPLLYKQMKVLRPCPRWWVCSTQCFPFLRFILFTCLHYLSSVLCVGSHMTACLLAWYSEATFQEQFSPPSTWVLLTKFGSSDLMTCVCKHQTMASLSVRTSGGSLWNGIFVCKIYLRSQERTSEITKLSWKG